MVDMPTAEDQVAAHESMGKEVSQVLKIVREASNVQANLVNTLTNLHTTLGTLPAGTPEGQPSANTNGAVDLTPVLAVLTDIKTAIEAQDETLKTVADNVMAILANVDTGDEEVLSPG